MATNIVQMTDGTGNKQYPVTSAEAVGMPDGSGNLTNYLDKRVTEYNVSVLHPTSGSGGSNKYTLETAIAQVPAQYRTIGIKCSFVNEAGQGETWEWKGGSWNVNKFSEIGEKKFSELDDKTYKSDNISNLFEKLPLNFFELSKYLEVQSFDEGSELKTGSSNYYAVNIDLDYDVILTNFRIKSPEYKSKALLYIINEENIIVDKIILENITEGINELRLTYVLKAHHKIGFIGSLYYGGKSSFGMQNYKGLESGIEIIGQQLTPTDSPSSAYAIGFDYMKADLALSLITEKEVLRTIENKTKTELHKNINITFETPMTTGSGFFINPRPLEFDVVVKKVHCCMDAGDAEIVVLSPDYTVYSITKVICIQGENTFDVDIELPRGYLIGNVGKFKYSSPQITDDKLLNFGVSGVGKIEIGKQLNVTQTLSKTNLFYFEYINVELASVDYVKKNFLSKEEAGDINTDAILSKVDILYKKSYVAVGDSITEGSSLMSQESMSREEAAKHVYCGLIAERHSMNYHNEGKGGTRIAKWNPFGRTIGYYNGSSLIGYDEIHYLTVKNGVRVFTTPNNCNKICITVANGLSGIDQISDLSSSLQVSQGESISSNFYSSSLNKTGKYVKYDGSLVESNGAIYAEINVAENTAYNISDVYEFSDYPSNKYRYNSFVERLPNILTKYSVIDYMTIMGGTNDGTNTPMGDINSKSPYEFYGAMNLMFKMILEKSPLIRIGVLGELHRNSGESIKTHNEAFVELSKKWSIPFLDLYSNSGIFMNSLIEGEKLTYDYTHPNLKGNIKLANPVEQFMRGL